MKAVFATILLSIFSAVVAVFSITELCAKAQVAASAQEAGRPGQASARAGQPRQKVQQWINY